MKIFSDDTIIGTEKYLIKFEDIILDVSEIQPRKVLEFLLNYGGIRKAKHIAMESKPEYFSKADILLLLAIGVSHLHIYCTDESKYYDITFSYNFPIILEPKVVEIILDNIDLIVESRLIALGEVEDFLRVDVTDDCKFKAFLAHNNDLIKRNDKMFIISEHYSIASALDKWKLYCYKKFGRKFTTNEIIAYNKIYASSGFLTLTYLLGNEIIAQGVVYLSSDSKTMYYCIFSWDEKFKAKSPGIYAYCKAIQKCHEMGYYFSFCYGLQQYKINLLREFLK